jgi:hypothetical protein
VRKRKTKQRGTVDTPVGMLPEEKENKKTRRVIGRYRCERGRERGDRERYSSGRKRKNETGGNVLLEDSH